MAKRIIIAGGGTGGHIFPAIAVANALKALDPGVDILFVGAKGKMEMEKVPRAGYSIEGLDIAGFNRSSLIRNIGLPFKLVKSFWQVRSIFNRFKPHAAFGVGGYSSFPVLKLAQQRGIPTFLHESNAFAGKSNMLLGKQATRVFTGTPGMERFFPKEKLEVTGNPIRKAIADNPYHAEQAKADLGFDPSRLLLMVVGGSQGARSINLAVEQMLQEVSTAGLQLLWQTGTTFEAQAMQVVSGFSSIKATAFIHDMAQAYAAADIVISRAGAMSVAELAVSGKAVIFVPFPFAAEDHQTYNAKQLADAGAAVLIADQDIQVSLWPAVRNLLSTEKRQSMQTAIKAFAVKDADVHIASSILKSIGHEA